LPATRTNHCRQKAGFGLLICGFSTNTRVNGFDWVTTIGCQIRFGSIRRLKSAAALEEYLRETLRLWDTELADFRNTCWFRNFRSRQTGL